ncbi:co-chaperone GroES [Candidatus Proelusimicrobium volucris]|uniref:co-chaperone GroES n=1 Tax=Candidatus Proelusimicrobium volucris TaxID=3416225 RepID=UPI003D0A68E4
MSIKIKPLGDRVIISPIEPKEVVKGGIIIPDSAKEKPMQGKVVAAGPGAVNKKGERLPMDVKEGDTVLYGKYSGTEIKLEDEKYIIMHQEEILGVIE